jgi:YD repeat-containing protein
MKLTLAIVIAGALCAGAQAQNKIERERGGLLGPVRSARAEAEEQTPGDGKTAGGRRVPLYSVTYDARGNTVERAEFNWDGSPSRKLVYTYDGQGRETGYEEYTGALASPRRHVYVLDERGKRIEYKIVQPDGAAGERLLYKYDAQGRLAEEELREHKGALIGRIVYAYDDRGAQVSRTGFNADGSVSYVANDTYDAAGRLTERARRDGGLPTYKVRYAYDRRGRLVEREAVGSVVETDFPPGEAPAPGRTVYVYQDKERPRELIAYAPDGSVSERVRVEYDPRGNWIRRTHQPRAPAAGGREPRRVEYRTITYF